MKAHVFLPVWLLLSSGPEVPQPAQNNSAHLVIYRQREFDGSAYTIKLNDKTWGPLPANRFLQLDVPPGQVKVESVTDYFSDNQTVRFDAQPGRTYYLKAVGEVDFLTRTLLMAPVSEEQGLRELQSIKPAAVPRTR